MFDTSNLFKNGVGFIPFFNPETNTFDVVADNGEIIDSFTDYDSAVDYIDELIK